MTTNYQQAADDAYVIGECIDALGTLLDRYFERHGEDLSDRLIALLPRRPEDIGSPTAQAIYAFAHSLEPVED